MADAAGDANCPGPATTSTVASRRRLAFAWLNLTASMRTALRFASLSLVVGCLLASSLAAKTHRVTVSAHESDRAAQLASFALPSDAPKPAALQAADGTVLPLQVDGEGLAWFIVPAQKGGEELTYTVTEAAVAAANGVEVTQEAEELKVVAAGRPVFAYRLDKTAVPRPEIPDHYKRAGYLHPVLSPSGKVVTGDYHPRREHHHGLWSAWTNTRFQGRTPDFWNTHEKKGRVDFVGVDSTWSGPVHGGFTARTTFVDLSASTPVPALHEFWTVRTYPVANATVIDLMLTQVCATSDPLILPAYRYGGMGYRANSTWLGRDLPKVLTSEGETDRAKAHTQKVRWLHLGGPVDGAWTGLAMMDHPENFRSPQPVRVGEAEPFFCFSPSQGGDWSIEPGKPYVARYRFVVMDGEPDARALDAFWAGHATRAVVSVD